MKTRVRAAGGGTSVCAGAVLTLLLLPCCDKTRHDVVAQVNDHDVTSTQAAEHLRGILWRNGEPWESLDDTAKQARRREAVDACVDQHLLEVFTTAHPAPADSVARQAEDDFQQFLKQFEPPDVWEKRANLQGLNATALKKRITTETGQSLALETWLSTQSPGITEANARAWYEAHHASLNLPERIRASQIFLTRYDKEKNDLDRTTEIQEILRKLKANEFTFGELAAKFSEDDGSKQRGGDMGWFSRERVPPEFAEKVFSLTVGQIGGPFESHLGWHIVLAREKRPARAAEFAEMKEEITALLDSKWREGLLKKLKQRFRAEAKIEYFEERLRTISPE